MKQIPSHNAHPDDEDIAQLFASQSVNVPAELQTSIFKQAELQCSKEARNSLWPRGFAIAATVSMVAIVTPMLMNEPAPSEESTNTDLIKMTSADNPEPTTTSSAASLDSEQSPKIVTREAETIAEDINNMKSFIAESTPALQSESNSAPSPAYRESPDKWMNEIKVLIANGDEKKAREEYRLFVQQHPTRTNDFKPDFERRAIVDDHFSGDDGDPK